MYMDVLRKALDDCILRTEFTGDVVDGALSDLAYNEDYKRWVSEEKLRQASEYATALADCLNEIVTGMEEYDG